jgi:tetratricopeptide (TPR) repeat protein
MSQSEAVNEFKKGLTALRKGYSNSAIAHLQKAVEHDNGNPFYLSYYGLALARSKHDWAMAEAYCLAALRLKCNAVHLYLNLAEVYRQAGGLEDALSTLYNGLQFTKWNSLLVRALEELGVRRPPVLFFLDRKNFLNRHLGKLRHRLGGQSKVSTLESLRAARS